MRGRHPHNYARAGGRAVAAALATQQADEDATCDVQRYIHLPALDKTVTLGQYVKAVKAAIAAPDAEFSHGLTTWWAVTGAEIRQQFRRGMNDRINQQIPCIERGTTG